jgi:ferritin-like metal-binding protein YciE
MAKKRTVQDLLADEIKDLYSAEKQLANSIPKMASGAHNSALRTALRSHLKETERQVARLEKIAGLLHIKLTGKKCIGMAGLIKEGAEALKEKGDETILDLGIIRSGIQVEHYEIAGYITSISLAARLEDDTVVTLLKQSLGEEQAAEEKMRVIGARLLEAAAAEF